jgi:hypothetical protein
MSNYKNRLNPWALVRCRLAEAGQAQADLGQVIERFRTSSDAEGRLRLLRQTMPHTHFAVVFDPQLAPPAPQPLA